jgi:hypothetical protein
LKIKNCFCQGLAFLPRRSNEHHGVWKGCAKELNINEIISFHYREGFSKEKHPHALSKKNQKQKIKEIVVDVYQIKQV